MGDLYINDAFGTAHRAHASTVGIVKHVANAGVGMLMADEVDHLGALLAHPNHPFIAILGGSKVSGKLDVIENLLERVDTLLLGGAMAYTFFKARGLPVGRSLVEDTLIDATRQIDWLLVGGHDCRWPGHPARPVPHRLVPYHSLQRTWLPAGEWPQ